MKVTRIAYALLLVVLPVSLAQPNQPEIPRQTGQPITSIQPVPSITIQDRGPFAGSIRGGERSNEPIGLTLDDAVMRGLKYNLGAVESGIDIDARRAERLQALSRLLPTVTARPSITEEQVNLATFGLSFPGVPAVVGPFTIYDFRGYASQSIINFPWLRNYRAGRET